MQQPNKKPKNSNNYNWYVDFADGFITNLSRPSPYLEKLFGLGHNKCKFLKT